jgi:hypothetical protein
MADPLTKVKRTGELYSRPPEIENHIEAALKLDSTALLKRVEAARGSPQYLPSECLVHLIRVAIRRGDQRQRNHLMMILFGRCEANLKGTIPIREVANAEHLRDELLSAFGLIVASEVSGDTSAELDYYECRFDRAFKMLRISVLRAEQKATTNTVTLPDEADTLEEATARKLEAALSTRATQDDRLLENEVLDALPTKEREAVVLHCVMGYDVESEDEDKETVATLCKVSGRTIRKRLESARKRVQTIQEGNV